MLDCHLILRRNEDNVLFLIIVHLGTPKSAPCYISFNLAIEVLLNSTEEIEEASARRELSHKTMKI